MNATSEQASQGSTSSGRVNRLRRIGWLGFFFFLAKGLVWLTIFLGAGALFGC
ncbi:MAG: hypothetical protein IPK99_05930 [Flavobacteriales bacterium]|nr:hypothetical protein [Flavobacteriales bacterium]